MTASRLNSPLRWLRGIIEHMAEMKDMYKMTKYIDSDRYDKLTESFLGLTNDVTLGMTADDYVSYRRLNKPSKTKTLSFIHLTKKNKYINWLDREKTMLHVTAEGHHLLGKKAYFYRSGLIDESLKHYDKTQTVFIIVLTSIITAIGGTVIGFILGKI